MVAVLHAAPEAVAPEALAAWLERTGAAYTADERRGIENEWPNSRPIIDEIYENVPADEKHKMWAGNAVKYFKLDAASVRAAVLLGAPHCANFNAETFAEQCGSEVAQIVVGAARMGAIRAAQEGAGKEARDAQAENLRKMLLAMVEDIRIVLIKLAERTQALRFLVGAQDALHDARAQAARETRDLFAPLANRLGVWQLKWELEDLSLRALEPETYKQIARMLDERRLDRQHAEVKSMHTAQAARGRGVARALVDHLVGVARERGYRRVSLETGAGPAFAPARALYATAGFAPCGPFAGYRPSADSAYMTLSLERPAAPD